MPNSSCHFPNRKSVLLQILCDSSVSWKITPLYFFRSNFIYFARKGSTILQFFQRYRIQIHQSLVIFERKSWFFFQFCVTLVSWNITPLYRFTWSFIYFQQDEPIKVQIWRDLTWAVKSLKFCTLMNSFCPNDIKIQLKKYRKVISHDTEVWCKI